MNKSICLWKNRFHLNTTNSIPFNRSNFNVSFFSPQRPPRISNNIIFFAIFLTVTNRCDSVVELCSTFRWIKDTFLIHLKNRIIGFNCYRCGRLSDGGFQLLNRVWLYFLNLKNVYLSFWLVLSAIPVFCSILVVFFQFDAVLLSVFHCACLPATIASLRSFITIDYLLLWETKELAWFCKVRSFNWGYCRKCPARSALPLILNWVDTSLFPPIYRFWEVFCV